MAFFSDMRSAIDALQCVVGDEDVEAATIPALVQRLGDELWWR